MQYLQRTDCNFKDKQDKKLLCNHWGSWKSSCVRFSNCSHLYPNRYCQFWLQSLCLPLGLQWNPATWPGDIRCRLDPNSEPVWSSQGEAPFWYFIQVPLQRSHSATGSTLIFCQTSVISERPAGTGSELTAKAASGLSANQQPTQREA